MLFMFATLQNQGFCKLAFLQHPFGLLDAATAKLSDFGQVQIFMFQLLGILGSSRTTLIVFGYFTDSLKVLKTSVFTIVFSQLFNWKVIQIHTQQVLNPRPFPPPRTYMGRRCQLSQSSLPFCHYYFKATSQNVIVDLLWQNCEYYCFYDKNLLFISIEK